ncbi:MAG: hypothetical protein WAT23_00520 [Chromatiaceae bacterium]
MISKSPTVATERDPNLLEVSESPESDSRSLMEARPSPLRVMTPDEIEQVNAFIDAFCFDKP